MRLMEYGRKSKHWPGTFYRDSEKEKGKKIEVQIPVA